MKVLVSKMKNKRKQSFFAFLFICLAMLAVGFGIFNIILFKIDAIKSFYLIIHAVSIFLLILVAFIYAWILRTTDYLCGIPNVKRFTFHLMACQMRKKLSKYNSFFFNIKNLKVFNRRYGSKCGDQILIGYSRALKEFCERGEMVARLGGDNFIALIKNEHVNDFLHLLTLMEVTITNNEGQKEKVRVETRLGGFEIQPENVLGDVFTCSSIAYNRAKADHKDVEWFTDQLKEQTYKEKEIVSMFRTALANKEFAVYYQPKYNMEEDEIVGAEALVRWIRDGQVISPADFIPTLECEGLVTQLDFYVLNQVCRDINKWIADGKEPVRISSNFSKIHLRNDYFGEMIINTLDAHNIDSKYIEIELTESAGYDDFEALKAFVEQMHWAKIAVSIDDFGTGYSSLSMLKNLMIDNVKLDRYFLSDVKDYASPNYKLIVNLVNMIKDLDFDVVCEGVESSFQKDMLLQADCQYAQGFLYSQPIPADEFERML